MQAVGQAQSRTTGRELGDRFREPVQHQTWIGRAHWAAAKELNGRRGPPDQDFLRDGRWCRRNGCEWRPAVPGC